MDTSITIAVIAASASILGIVVGALLSHRLNGPLRTAQIDDLKAGVMLKLQEYEDKMSQKTHERLAEIEDHAEKTQTIVEEISKDQVHTAAAIENVKTLLEQVKPYPDYSDAFKDAEQKMEDYLVKDPQASILIRIIAVASTFSWQYFVQKNVLTNLLTQYDQARISLDLLILEPKFIENLELDLEGVDWRSECKQRIKDANQFALDAQKFDGRLSFIARSYWNLPHWHGVLINRDHLYLGRTDWSFANRKPKLTVGTNKYRHFDYNELYGRERIFLFENWHRYYAEYEPHRKIICGTRGTLPAAPGV